MKKNLLSFLFSCFVVFLSAQSGLMPVVQVKLTPEAEQRLQYGIQPFTATAGPLNVGIRSLDAVNARVGAKKMQRVFTIGGPYEERQRKFGLHLWYEISIDEQAGVETAAADYATLPEVEEASPKHRIRPIAEVPLTEEEALNAAPQAAATDDPMFKQQWHYHNTGQAQSNAVPGFDIRLPEAWDLVTGNTAVIVSVVDGGIDYNHPDLKNNMWPNIGQNFIPGMGGGVTPHHHGTHVAGTIGAATNNGTGVSGIAGGWGAAKGVQLMSCQIFDEEVKTQANTAAAIQFGADHGAVISQNSWGYEDPGGYDPAVRTAIQYFIKYAGKDNNENPLPGTPMAGGIVIFAAGNDSSNRNDWYPAAWPEVLSVAAIGPAGKRAYYSNYSNTVDITAPGGDQRVQNPYGGVLSTVPTSQGSYDWFQGTSMACPHVSGIAALILSRLGSSTFTPGMLRRRLILSARPLPGEPEYVNGNMGAGLIDACRAVLDSASVAGITLPAVTQVYHGRSVNLSLTFDPVIATDQRVHWQTADAGIATVNAFGTVSGHQFGATTITATTVDGNKTAVTTVNVVPVPVAGIDLTPKEVLMKDSEARTVNANITPVDASDKTIVWSSGDESVATVNNTGVITAVAPGSTTVTATTNDGGFSGACTITVVLSVRGVYVQPLHIDMLTGDTATVHTSIEPADAYDKNVSWSSSNSGIVSVNAAGKVQAKKAGSARVTVRTNDGGYTAVCNIEVYDAVKAPEAFSPNGDGINDYFELVLDSRDTYTLQVFDRSGQVYYQSSNYNNDWDGTANTGKYDGNKIPAGTYFYRLSGNTSGHKSGYLVVKY